MRRAFLSVLSYVSAFFRLLVDHAASRKCVCDVHTELLDFYLLITGCNKPLAILWRRVSRKLKYIIIVCETLCFIRQNYDRLQISQLKQ